MLEFRSTKMRSITAQIMTASIGLLLLGACSNATKTSDSDSPKPPTPPAETQPMANAEKSHMAPRKGGQVVESGKYHLELVPEKAANSTHLDFYLLSGDKHQIVPNAKVSAELQSPDGKQKTLPFSYDASGKHYAAVVSDKATGQYQVKVIATVGSEKIDGRFNFDR
jgi:hypothetical protein